jgi:hypothetical protein
LTVNVRDAPAARLGWLAHTIVPPTEDVWTGMALPTMDTPAGSTSVTPNEPEATVPSLSTVIVKVTLPVARFKVPTVLASARSYLPEV